MKDVRSRWGRTGLNSTWESVRFVFLVSQNPVSCYPWFSRNTLPQKEIVCNLRYHLALQVLLKEQVAAMAEGIFAQDWPVHQIYLFTDWFTLSHALVTSQLDYDNALYTGLLLKDIQKLHKSGMQ